jgi:adenylosuccinate lyase
MRRNLERSRGLVFSQRVLLALVEAGVARDEAYRLVQRSAARAAEEERDFGDIVVADDEITARINPAALAEAFDLGSALRHVPVVFERLSALTTRTEEEVRV